MVKQQGRIQSSDWVEGARGAGQDRVSVLEREWGLSIALADGAGGRPGGAEVAQRTTQLVDDWVSKPLVPGDCVDLLRCIDLEIAREDEPGWSTAVVALIVDGQISGATVGDSEAWLFGESSDVGLASGQGRSALMGSGRARPRPISGALANSTLLIASDGLWKYSDRSQLRHLARRGDARQLADLARLPGGGLQDDVSVVVARRDA